MFYKSLDLTFILYYIYSYEQYNQQICEHF